MLSVRLFVAFFLVVILSGCSSMTLAPESMLSYQKVHEVDLSARQIFDKSQEWLAVTFVDSKEVIESVNPDTGKIIGSGTVTVWNAGIAAIPVRFTVVIEAKEGRYRTTFNNYVAYWGQSRSQPVPVKYESIAVQTNEKVKLLANDLLAYLEDQESGDSW